jgi:hypothetical protein
VWIPLRFQIKFAGNQVPFFVGPPNVGKSYYADGVKRMFNDKELISDPDPTSKWCTV